MLCVPSHAEYRKARPTRPLCSWPVFLPEGGSEFGDRVRRRLREEIVAWFTTVGADGTPQPNPIWFLWEGGDDILIYNRADAARLRHLSRRPRATFHFDGNGRGGDIVVLPGEAARTEEPPPHEVPAYVEKYRDRMIRVSGSLERFSEQYPVPLRFRPEKVRD